MAKKFSPPYGDSTYDSEKVTNVLTFSPPYGDGTQARKTERGSRLVFAPLRGWYCYSVAR